MIKDAIAVLDIGTTKIVGMVGRKGENGKTQIIAKAERKSEGVSRGLVENINDVSSTIKDILDEIYDRTGIEIKDVYVGIAGQHITSRIVSQNIRLEEKVIINENHVKQLISQVHDVTLDSEEKILHVFPQEYSVDNKEVAKPVGIYGQLLAGTFHLSIARITDLKVLKMAVEEAGLNIKSIILEPVASAEAVLINDEKEAGVALVDIGGGTSDLIIYKNNEVRYTAVIPFGGNTITNDIAEGLDIPKKDAEQLKIKYGTAMPEIVSSDQEVQLPGINGREPRVISVKTLAEIIRFRVKEIIDTVLSELKKAGYERLAGITLTGGGALLKDLKQYVDFRSHLSTTIGIPKNFEASKDVDVKNPKYATAIGLLKKAFEYQKSGKILSIEDEIKKNQNEQDDKKKREKKEEGKKFFGKMKEAFKNFFIDNDDNVID